MRDIMTTANNGDFETYIPYGMNSDIIKDYFDNLGYQFLEKEHNGSTRTWINWKQKEDEI